jgi:protein TonB
MELKKNSHSDLRRWQGPVFNLGLAISVGAVLAAFEWKAEEEKPLLDLSRGTTNWDTDIIPITIQTPPEAPRPPIAPSKIEIVDNTTQIDDVFTIDLGIPENVALPEIKLEGPPVVETSDEILDFTQVRAEFKDGTDGWLKYLRSNLTYPRQAQRMGIEGTVLVRFVINTDGSVQDVEVVRSVDLDLDKAAIDVISKSPKWKPGLHHGRPVRSRMTIPIKFKLN